MTLLRIALYRITLYYFISKIGASVSLMLLCTINSIFMSRVFERGGSYVDNVSNVFR